MNGIGVLAGLSLRNGFGAAVLAEDSTPATVEVPACDLDLDSADFIVVLQIPETIAGDALQGIELTLRSRINALGWTSCSVDRIHREMLVNVQFPALSDIPTTDEILSLLSEPGRIDLVNGGQGRIEVGDRIVTTPLPPDGPMINVVYETILSNGDFSSVSVQTTDLSQDVIRFEVTREAADRLAEFTLNNVGGQMPVVIDGIVVAVPVIQTQISESFDLQMTDPALNNSIIVYASALPYPDRLDALLVRDARATPES